ncbi:MAG: lipid kinase YegS [Lysobacteraceae bacterium]|nr:MAG: lipid kinase YegS [Xanthomonadaceae bacterium]
MEASRRWRLVLNGKSAGDEAVRDAVAALRQAGIGIDVRVTWEGGDAERYVAEAIGHGVDTIIAAGGDGTLSEVAATLAHRTEPALALPTLGLLPLGTANDFAAATGIPAEPEAALRLVRDTVAVPVDLIRLDANQALHWVANLASGGFGTQVTTETHDGLKKLLGGLAYVLTGLSKLGRIEPLRARLQGPGFEWEGDFIALGIGNGRQAGGGQALCPEAMLDDGLLDVTVVPPLDGELLATIGTALAEGKHAALDRVALRHAMAWVEIESSAALTLNLDGEPVEATRFRIDCVPGRVRMHLPADCPLLGNPATVGP